MEKDEKMGGLHTQWEVKEEVTGIAQAREDGVLDHAKGGGMG